MSQPAANLSFTINERKFAFAMTYDQNCQPDRDTVICVREFGCPEPEIVHVMTRVLREGDFAIDGGANIGFFTMVMAQLVGGSGSVLAVEPGENNLHKLRENLKINKVQNVEICDRPLWSSNENVTLHYHEHGGMNSLSAYQPMMGKKQLQGATLNSWMMPRLLKLDIEGAEEHALRGVGWHLANKCPYIIVELNEKALWGLGSSEATMRHFMHTNGYTTFLLHANGGLPSLVPETTAIKELEGRNGTLNIMFSTIEAVGAAWPEVRL